MHRRRYVVSALVDGAPNFKSITKAVAYVTALVTQGENEETNKKVNKEENDEKYTFAICVGCDNVGLIGNFYKSPSCEDSGNMFSDNPFSSSQIE